MKAPKPRVARLARQFVALLLSVVSAASFSGPGAHGPDGEHLDEPSRSASAAKAPPRLEATTDLFELVAQLRGSELSLLIDRFETNEPVLGARVDVESGSAKATAKFHPDHGDYAVEDPALLALLSQPGEHALVITVVAGNDSDLLHGTLIVPAATAQARDDHDHDHDPARGVWASAGMAVLGIVGILVWRRRRRLASSAIGVSP